MRSLLCFASALLFLASNTVATDRPNILFAIADDWSQEHASAYGCDWVETPHFDRLAAEGLLFDRAYTPNAKCAPSRAIVLTGRNSWQLEEAGNHVFFFPAKFGGWMERLSDHGYLTGYTGKGWGPGKANDAEGKRRAITGKAYQTKKLKPHAKAMSTTDYAANFGDFLADATADEQPWAFWFGTYEPHRRYEYGAGVRLGKKLSDIDRVPTYWPDTEVVRNDMLDYAVEVEHFDTHLGRIMQLLEDAGQLDNTLIVATSDHGMPFPRVKGNVYAHGHHVPLAIRWPQGIVGQGRRIADYVTFADLAPTFLQAAGVAEPGPIMQPITGQSLFDIFTQDGTGQINPTRDHVLLGKERHDLGRPNNWGYPGRAIIKDDMMYVRNYEPSRWPAGNPETGYLNCDGGATKTQILEMRRSGENTHYWELCFGKREAEALYDLSADRDCVKNEIKTAKYQELIGQLRDQMETELADQGDPRMQGQGHIFDSYPYADPRSDNYHQRYTSGEKVPAGWVNPTDYEKEPLD